MSTAQMTLPDANEPGKMHANPQRTERAAALAILPKSGSRRMDVLEAIIAAGYRGMTDAEIQQALNMNPNTERPRRVELVEGGWICDSGFQRSSATADVSIVWVLTATGRTRLAQLAKATP